MKEIIERKIKDLEETKSIWIDRLDHGSLFDDSYVYERIKTSRDKIDVLKDILDEYEEGELNGTTEEN